MIPIKEFYQLHINNFLISKIVSNLVNIIINYFLSLKLIFI